jgi:hypothetical protein
VSARLVQYAVAGPWPNTNMDIGTDGSYYLSLFDLLFVLQPTYLTILHYTTCNLVLDSIRHRTKTTKDISTLSQPKHYSASVNGKIKYYTRMEFLMSCRQLP